ncbi:hypothetical protein [Aeromonas veronii]|uniref:hypothetical protein n=1 Tax=Aeromonas veronii TaxID=654 RepID=UPI0030057094
MSAKKLKLGAFILMILTSVFGVTNIGIGFYRMGYAAIPMFVIGGLFFFIPFILMMIEFGTGFRKEAGGIFTWMRHSVSTALFPKSAKKSWLPQPQVTVTLGAF